MDLKIDPDRNSPPPRALSGRASAGVISIGVEYENSDFLVINKPAGLPVYSTKKHLLEESVLSWFLRKYPQVKTVGDSERPGVVHRLDKQTSGLLFLAKTYEGFDYLKKLFKDRKIIKEYQALVYGQLPRHGVIDEPLSKIGFRGSSRVRVAEEGKAAVTEYWTKEFYHPAASGPPLLDKEGNERGGVDPVRDRLAKGTASAATGRLTSNGVDSFTLVRIRLHTGRTHQIRVHFASIKHPVMGDDLYGQPKSQALKDILHRQFLHASRLEFQLMDGTWLEVESDPPEDLQEVLGKLSF